MFYVNFNVSFFLCYCSGAAEDDCEHWPVEDTGCGDVPVPVHGQLRPVVRIGE